MNALQSPSQAQNRSSRRLRLGPAAITTEKALTLLSVQPRRADAVWTAQEWAGLMAHLHNDNPPFQYIMAFRDEAGVKQYQRSKTVKVQRAISWAWSTITGKTRSPLAFVPYATNANRQSRWGGIDFDAHDGDAERACRLAFDAFAQLLKVTGVAVILETSGSGGWHVWAIHPEFQPVNDWVRLLKDVCHAIGTTIASGICEIYPPDSPATPFGRGLRAPGCWNPGTDTCSEIVWENTRHLLGEILAGPKNGALPAKDLRCQFPEKRNKLLSLPPLFR